MAKAARDIAGEVGKLSREGARIVFVRGDAWALLVQEADRRGITPEQLVGYGILFAIEYPDEVLDIDPAKVLGDGG
jgi:hypothetical protein